MFTADRAIIIGRAPDSALKLDDEEVSSRHASLRLVDGRLIITDTNSRNGLFVNGRKVQSAEVTAFDEIYIGGCRLKVELVGGPQPTDHAEAGQPGEKTRVATSPFMHPVAEPAPAGPPATAPRVPAVAEPPEIPSEPSTSPYLPGMAEQLAQSSQPSAPAARPTAPPRPPPPPLAVPTRGAPPPAAPARGGPPPAAPARGGPPLPVPPAAVPPAVSLRPPAVPPPPPVTPRPAAAPPPAHVPRFGEGPAPGAAPFVDEDARTTDMEFTPGAVGAAADAGKAAAYWDFDEESATVPGRSLKDVGVDPAQAARVLSEIGTRESPKTAAFPPVLERPPGAPPPPAPPPQPFPVLAGPPAAPAPRPPPPPPVLGPRVASPAVPDRTEETPIDLGGDEEEAALAGPPTTPTPRVDPMGADRARARREAGAEAMGEMPLPPRPRYLGEDEDLDEEEIEERDWLEPFSLLENVLRDHPKPPSSSTTQPVLEVIRYRGRRILDVARLGRGRDLDVFHPPSPEHRGAFRLIKLQRDGRARLNFTPTTEGSVVLAGVTTPLRDLCVDERLARRRQRIYSVMLCEGDYAQVLMEGGGGFLTRFVRPPTPPVHTFGSDFSHKDLIFFGCGLGAMLIVILGLWGAQALAGPAEIRLQEEELTFAQVSLKEAALEKPPEPKKVEAPESPKNVEMPQLERIQVAAKAPRRVARGPGPPAASPEAPAPPKPAGVLSALNDLRPAADSGDSALRAAVSNIAAVRVPTGTSAGFQVTGTFSKLPGGEVRLATGGGGGGGKGRETRVGAELFAGEKGKRAGALAGGGGGGKVRGTVQSAGRPVTKGGLLDAAAVQRVVTEHLAAIQACYERQLIKDPGLQGKLTFDWDVAPGGAVSTARMASSSMGTGGGLVAACIVTEIRRWRFPSPIGGTAQVRYPFIFRMSGF